MRCKSILTEERTNNNESLKDIQSQLTYKDFAVKDIPINEQNDYIGSSKDTSSTYTIEEDFVVKDIPINKQNESSKDTLSTYTTDKDFAVKDTDLYYCEKCTNFQRGNYCFQCENPLMRDKDFEVEPVNYIVKQNSFVKDNNNVIFSDEELMMDYSSEEDDNNVNKISQSLTRPTNDLSR